MEDLRALFRITTKHKGKLLMLALLVATTIFYWRTEVEFVEISPDQTYRLEYHRASALQHLLLHREMDLPLFARLYRNFDNRYFGESPVIDFVSGINTYWLMEKSGEVAFGGVFAFTDVPPVAPGGIVLEIPPNSPDPTLPSEK